MTPKTLLTVEDYVKLQEPEGVSSLCYFNVLPKKPSVRAQASIAAS